MAYSTRLTVEQALVGMKGMEFPPGLVQEGDVAWFPGGTIGTDIGHRFKWDGTQWVSDTAELPVV